MPRGVPGPICGLWLAWVRASLRSLGLPLGGMLADEGAEAAEAALRGGRVGDIVALHGVRALRPWLL